MLGEVDRLRGGAQDRHAGVGELLRELERGLAAELDEHAHHAAGAFFGGDDLQHVFERERLEVQAGGDVVVGGDGFRVAVDHHGLVAGLAQRHRGVDAGVVELDALADPVGPGAEDDDGRLGVQRDLVLLVVGGVVVRRVRGELGGAGVHGLVDRADAEGLADAADDVLGVVRQGADLLVGEAVALGALQHLRRSGRRPCGFRARSRSAAGAGPGTRGRSWWPRRAAPRWRRRAGRAGPGAGGPWWAAWTSRSARRLPIPGRG